MLEFNCPACGHKLNLKSPKAGRFRPRCSKCKESFQLVIDAGLTLARAERIAPEPDTKIWKRVVAPKVIEKVEQHKPKQPASATKQTPVNQPTQIDDGSAPAEQGGQFSLSPAAMPRTKRLGGYRLISELGRGGLGVVFRAQQVSLNRDVALKLIQSHLAGESTAVARFFREAYAAAQLTHHNVVQIYDMGQDAGTNFFSMELVRGKNLAELLCDSGKLDQRQAAGYILQAARGLHFAHEQGMVHRDVKPANLMIDTNGVVKVADLGLVKVANVEEPEPQPHSEKISRSQSISLTTMGTTVGTANYIAPEQVRDSSNVDLRADIYSLGCTFYALLTGAPPFAGDTAEEVIRKHLDEPPRPLAEVGVKIDPRLSGILMKMVEKEPKNRYTSLETVIRDLETWLGLDSEASYSPTEQQTELLSTSQQSFNKSPLIWLRNIVPLAIAGVLVLVALVLLFSSFRWSLASVLAIPVVPGTLLVLGGIRQRSPVFDRIREWIALSGWRIWLSIIPLALLLATLAFVTGLLIPWFVMAVLAGGATASCFFAIDETLFRQREVQLEPTRKMFRSLRTTGIDEIKLRKFVAGYCGRDWEEFFEHLFGYSALVTARKELAATPEGSNRKKFRPWRDTLIKRIDDRIMEKRQEKDVSSIRAVEQQALVAGGASAADAAREADRISQQLVHHGAELRASAAAWQPERRSGTSATVIDKRARFSAMMAAARDTPMPRSSPIGGRIDQLLNAILGSHIRMILGAALLTGCVMWLNHNHMFSRLNLQEMKSATESAIQSRDVSNLANDAVNSLQQPRQPLSWPIFGSWFSSFNAGAAGLLLLISLLFRGWKAGIVFLAVAAVVWLGGSFGIPGLGPWQ